MENDATPTCTLLLCIALAAGMLCSPAAAQVYKCAQDRGGVLYSDVPCKGGAVVDVEAGTANPAAVRQLARDNAAFDRKLAARRAAEDQAEFRREQLNAQMEVALAAQASAATTDAGPYYYAPGNAFVVAPRVKRHTHRQHATPVSERRVPANPPPPNGLRRSNP
jgi:hypothetical protein